MSDRVYIFDTTLRDGEQSPGCSMTAPRSCGWPRKLVELGVDILEAGFPIASEGDFEAVDAVSREFPWVQVAALARCLHVDVERAAASLKHAQAAAHPHLHRHQRHSPEVQAEEDPAQQVLDEAVAAVEAGAAVTWTTSSSPPKTRRAPTRDYLEEISKR